MAFQILYPFHHVIDSDSFANAIKYFVKMNDNLKINNMIIKDRHGKSMAANLKYYKNNKKNKVGINYFPIVPSLVPRYIDMYRNSDGTRTTVIGPPTAPVVPAVQPSVLSPLASTHRRCLLCSRTALVGSNYCYICRRRSSSRTAAPVPAPMPIIRSPYVDDYSLSPISPLGLPVPGHIPVRTSIIPSRPLSPLAAHLSGSRSALSDDGTQLNVYPDPPVIPSPFVSAPIGLGLSNLSLLS